MIERYSYLNLIEKAKASQSEYVNIEIPAIMVHFITFCEGFDISTERFYSISQFNRQERDADKKSLFENLGFNVLFMSTDFLNTAHFIERADISNTDISIEQAFLDNQRNVFMFCVESGSETLFYVLEYIDPSDPLAEHTVDREALAEKKARQEQMRSIFNFGKSKK